MFRDSFLRWQIKLSFMYKLVLRLDVGSTAEDFTLESPDGEPFSLRDVMGGSIIFLTFFRGGFDAESVKYLKELNSAYDRLKDMGVEVIAITPEMPQKARGLVDSLSLKFKVLCDPEMKVVRQYDVYDPVSEWCWPAGFLIDRDGTIQYVFRGVSPPNTPPIRYILKKIEGAYALSLKPG
jgi:peroxiredoxin Q/BCP